MEKLKIAVVGAGFFGANHVRIVSQSNRAELVAVVDANLATAEAAAAPHGARALTDHRELRGLADAAIVAVPTTAHAAVGCDLLTASLDVLVEKPIAADLASAKRLVEAARAAGRILQVGHLERFNPAVLALEAAATLPLFFEIHRLSEFSPRSLDIDVVLDLMIHDLDIVLSLARGKLEEIRASGISILSSKTDIANVRLQFDDGAVANLTASRVSIEKVRKLRVFQPGQYLSVDYSRQDFVAVSVDQNRKISFGKAAVAKAEPLQLQFDAFLDSVAARTPPKVDGGVALRTLDLALRIVDKIEEHAGIVAHSIAKECQP
ncbi:MAG TPA: gfo/Idh/MocA family oxidoreductase [Solibacterales bacterium]|nr:gfo/Idh/MocA family oxidoreductase [Bryobacterales bacterium]